MSVAWLIQRNLKRKKKTDKIRKYIWFFLYDKKVKLQIVGENENKNKMLYKKNKGTFFILIHHF